MIYQTGRIFQIIGLIAMPYAIWVGEFGRDEAGAIGIFAGSSLVFFIGYLLTRVGKKG